MLAVILATVEPTVTCSCEHNFAYYDGWKTDLDWNLDYELLNIAAWTDYFIHKLMGVINNHQSSIVLQP